MNLICIFKAGMWSRSNLLRSSFKAEQYIAAPWEWEQGGVVWKGALLDWSSTLLLSQSGVGSGAVSEPSSILVLHGSGSGALLAYPAAPAEKNWERSGVVWKRSSIFVP